MSFSKFIYRSKYKYGKYLNLKSPLDVTLELSSLCNQKCQYCYHGQDEVSFKKGVMGIETAKRILDQSKEMGVSSVKLNWRGESTINPNFYAITKHAKYLDFIDRISNSNFNFNPNKEDIFLAFKNQTKIKISFDSFDKIVFVSQRYGSDFETILKNIDTFYNKYITDENEVIIQMVRTKLNENEDLETLAKSRWPNVGISIRDCVGNRASGASNLSKDIPKKRVPCYQAFARLIFDINGNATCCCPDVDQNFNFGNIWNNKITNRSGIELKEIWENHRLNELRCDLMDGSAFDLYKSCSNCSSLESYENYKYSWDS